MSRHLALFVVAVLLPIPLQAEQLTDAKFQELLRELQPTEGERWRTIRWRLAVLEAQREAAKGNKPIFIWAMDGHPLGCT